MTLKVAPMCAKAHIIGISDTDWTLKYETTHDEIINGLCIIKWLNHEIFFGQNYSKIETSYDHTDVL